MADLQVTAQDVWKAFVHTGEVPSAIERMGQWSMTAKAARAMHKLFRDASAEAGDIDAARIMLCKKHGLFPAPAGETAPPRDEAGFAVEWTALMAEVITLPGCRALHDEELAPTVRPTPAEMEQLGPFLVEGPLPAA